MSEIGPLFSISPINVAHSAIRLAERHVSIDAPVEISIDSDDPAGWSQLLIRVTSSNGAAHAIPVSDEAIAACLAEPDHERVQRKVTNLVNGLAQQIRAALRASLSR